MCQPNEKGTLCLNLDLNCPTVDSFEAKFESNIEVAKCEQGTLELLSSPAACALKHLQATP